MPTLVKIAGRELRASPAKFGFVVLAVAVGVGALAGVRGFSRGFRAMLLREARTLMAADMSLRIFALPTPRQEAVLQKLEARGVRRTQITETVTMATSEAVREPLLVTLKAVDPLVYPFYGSLRLAPMARLDATSAAVSEDLLLRLRVGVGETLRLGGRDFRIAAVIASEPDRMTGTLNVGPRVMLARSGLERAGLLGAGSRASQRYLFRLPPGLDVQAARLILRRAFPEATIADFRETHPVITRGLNRAETYLSLVSLIAVIVGALGVATAMRAHLQQKMDGIAVMKCLGARSSQVMRIYLAQTLLLAAVGGVLGVAMGLGVQAAFPLLIARFFPQRPPVAWDFASAAEGLAAAVLATLLFTLPPLVSIRGIRPLSILRRDMPEAPHPRRAWLYAAAIVPGLALLAAWLAGRLEMALIFVGALAGALLLLAGVARLLLRGLRALPLARLPVTARHGLANLYRPGSQAAAVLVALGVGVMFTLTVYLLQRTLLTQMMNSAPPGMPNVFLLDIPGPDRQAVAEVVAQVAGARPEVAASVAVKLAAIDAVPVEKLGLERYGRRFLRTRSVTWLAKKPAETEILAGAWFEGPEPQVCVSEDAAGTLRLRPGARLDWDVWGKRIATRVACVQRTDSVRMSARFEFLFNPGVLEGFPAVYYGSARIEPRRVAALQRALYERFPTITVINVADVLQIVQQVVDQIAVVYRFIAGFMILAGAVILASAVAGTRFRRVREAAILKSLGATRRRVAGIFSVEFLVLGLLAGGGGALLANGLTAVVLEWLLEGDFEFHARASAAAVGATALLANAAGWAASYRILGHKPLEVLRHE